MPPNTALTPALLQELVVAALGSPLLSECQKSTVVSVLETYGYGAMAMLQGTSVRLGGTHEYAAQWPLLALVKKPNVSSRLMRVSAADFIPHRSLSLMTAFSSSTPTPSAKPPRPTWAE